LHRRQRRDCRRHYVLRSEFSTDATRFFNALGVRLVSLDSIAGVVRFRSLDSVPTRRHPRAEGRDELGIVGGIFRRGRSRGCRMDRLAEV
jgi:hypothetical protein